MPTRDSCRLAAVDLGASNGRVMLAEFGKDQRRLIEVLRFPNGPLRLDGSLHWDVVRIYRDIIEGLRRAGAIDAIGIDGWAVDYGLLDASGALLGNPFHYRDERTQGVAKRVNALIPADDLYRRTGVQVQQFNTIYQLVASRGTPAMKAAERLLLIPDLLSYWLTGVQRTELTNASTTGLLDAKKRSWATDIMQTVGIPAGLFTELIEPGTVIGPVASGVAEGLWRCCAPQVVAVGSHDTASAVAAVPALTEEFAFVATGTWSLVGVELNKPVLSEAGRVANFTNELGIDGTIRYLRNVMGLWLLQECVREWGNPPLPELLHAAWQAPALRHVVDASDPSLLTPGSIPDRLAAACLERGWPAPTTRPAVVRCILDSLALAHARAIRLASLLSGKEVETIHLVGGGVHNSLLCQLTADACGRPVIAGPAEAAAWGNALVQARAIGAVSGGLRELRATVRATVELAEYSPRGEPGRWVEAEMQLFGE